MAHSTDLQWTLGSTIVDGTLVMPDGIVPFAAVAMAAGSGPTDWDWTSSLLRGSSGLDTMSLEESMDDNMGD